MAQVKPWMTSNNLIKSVKRRILFPTNQATFNDDEILKFANEELMNSQVPSILQFHEEYFVQKLVVPLESNQSRYPIPNRAIGMKLRDLFHQDSNGNLFEMSQITSEAKAVYQINLGSNMTYQKYYVEGNEIVVVPNVGSAPTGSLVFFIYLRPNQLVKDERAAIIKSFNKKVTIDNAQIVAGDTFKFNSTTFTAVAGAPSSLEFQIGGTSIITASNLMSAINASGVTSATTDTPPTSTIVINYTNLKTTTMSTNNPAAIQITTQQGVEFNSLESSYFNPFTQITEDLFLSGSVIDILQTNPGHRTYNYDITIQNIDGNSAYFNPSDISLETKVGDYICLQHECIIPQIPPDLHNLLAERTSSRILSAIGDRDGLQVSAAKIAEMEKNQGSLIDNRVDGSIQKISARHSILRHQSYAVRRRRF